MLGARAPRTCAATVCVIIATKVETGCAVNVGSSPDAILRRRIETQYQEMAVESWARWGIKPTLGHGFRSVSQAKNTPTHSQQQEPTHKPSTCASPAPS
ncbi:hypothetical protein BC567DRAFT_232894 [Phyllosticta citribraziliensis]